MPGCVLHVIAGAEAGGFRRQMCERMSCIRCADERRSRIEISYGEILRFFPELPKLHIYWLIRLRVNGWGHSSLTERQKPDKSCACCPGMHECPPQDQG